MRKLVRDGRVRGLGKAAMRGCVWCILDVLGVVYVQGGRGICFLCACVLVCAWFACGVYACSFRGVRAHDMLMQCGACGGCEFGRFCGHLQPIARTKANRKAARDIHLRIVMGVRQGESPSSEQ